MSIILMWNMIYSKLKQHVGCFLVAPQCLFRCSKESYIYKLGHGLGIFNRHPSPYIVKLNVQLLVVGFTNDNSHFEVVSWLIDCSNNHLYDNRQILSVIYLVSFIDLVLFRALVLLLGYWFLEPYPLNYNVFISDLSLQS